MDGILSVNYRRFVYSKSANRLVNGEDTMGLGEGCWKKCCMGFPFRRKWLVFDGTMDASWLENLHTVLDDTRKLCLKSGESISLSKNVNLIFETANVDFVSPSVVRMYS